MSRPAIAQLLAAPIRQGRIVVQAQLLQTTAAAATTNGGVITSLSIIIIGYAVLGAVTILI